MIFLFFIVLPITCLVFFFNLVSLLKKIRSETGYTTANTVFVALSFYCILFIFTFMIIGNIHPK
ncbi:hypothetical protein DUZ99_12125 [Xylanibacillus composti]|nr:hypothetical protein [Xylanibacillus composti]MDT9725721.1 hypothetical protein [Xylanibacillus composti]